MAFELKDTEIYDDLFDTPAAARTKGQAEVIRDVFGFWITAITAAQLAAEQVCAFIYRARQVYAGKRTGTGEAILAGDRLYYYVSDGLVSPTAIGTAGTDYYFCGWAKEDAAASDDEVWMNFDGTRWDEDI